MLEAVVRLGVAGPRQVISIAVDATGQISELNVAPIPLRSRAALHMAPVSLPIPSGNNEPGTETIVVNDDTRSGRAIPVQLWYPTSKEDSTKRADARYAPAATSMFLAEQLAVPARDISTVTTHATESSPVKRAGGPLPIVMVSPGQGITRTMYSGLSAELASHGYFVAVFDHPGDGQLVEYPDGHTVPAEDASDDTRMAVRVADARAVLDRLQVLDADVASSFHDVLDLEHVAFVGHSLGGATAAETMHVDDRFDAGVDLDGTLYGDVAQTGLARPFLLVSSDRQEDPSWKTFRGGSTQTQSLVLRGTGHMTFTDWPTLSLFRPSNEPRASFDIGTIDPGRAFTIQSAYVLAFLDEHLRGEPQPLLAGSPPQYSEAEIPIEGGTVERGASIASGRDTDVFEFDDGSCFGRLATAQSRGARRDCPSARAASSPYSAMPSSAVVSRLLARRSHTTCADAYDSGRWMVVTRSAQD